MSCWLIKPAKSEIGILSKVELEKINRAITSKTKCNQQHNTQAVIDWFKSIPNKTKSRFIKFEIVEFDPSITEKLLDNAVSYAQTQTRIGDDIIQLMKQARKSLLFIEGSIWMKKSENPLIWCYSGITWWCRGLWACWYFPTWKIIQHHRQGRKSVYIEMTSCLLFRMQTDLNFIV